MYPPTFAARFLEQDRAAIFLEIVPSQFWRAPGPLHRGAWACRWLVVSERLTLPSAVVAGSYVRGRSRPAKTGFGVISSVPVKGL